MAWSATLLTSFCSCLLQNFKHSSGRREASLTWYWMNPIERRSTTSTGPFSVICLLSLGVYMSMSWACEIIISCVRCRQHGMRDILRQRTLDKGMMTRRLSTIHIFVHFLSLRPWSIKRIMSWRHEQQRFHHTTHLQWTYYKKTEEPMSYIHQFCGNKFYPGLARLLPRLSRWSLIVDLLPGTAGRKTFSPRTNRC